MPKKKKDESPMLVDKKGGAKPGQHVKGCKQRRRVEKRQPAGI